MAGSSSDISLEPLLNKGNLDLGEYAKVTGISEIGACSNRAAVVITGGAAATLITIGAGKSAIEIHNAGAADCYYGGSGVLTTTGIPLFTDHKVIFTKVKSTFSIYFISINNTTLRIAEYG